MNLFVTILFVAVATVSAQQQLDPSYLRQYYAQAAQHANGQAPRASTPIFEPQEQQHQPQYVAPKQNVSFKIQISRGEISHVSLL